MGVESVVAGHEHTSMSVIAGQLPPSIYKRQLPTAPGYSPLGNAAALAQWSYCFDRNDTDTSRGNTTVTSGVGNNWDCSVPGSLNSADPNWNAAAAKLVPAPGAGVGERGHLKTVEGMKWMAEKHARRQLLRARPPGARRPVQPERQQRLQHRTPAQLQQRRARDVAFGMETQPGHGASDARGEYTVRRNNFGTGVGNVDSVGGTTWGGTGVYGAQIGGVWDALLGEGRNFWFFASSDWHNRGMFGPDDRRSTQDFYPGEYQRDYRDGATASTTRAAPDTTSGCVSPEQIVDGLRSGNSWADAGQIIDRLAFVACADTKLNDRSASGLMEAAALGREAEYRCRR